MSDSTGESIDDDLATFVHRWAEAIAANDVDRMADFVTPDWMSVPTNGRRTSWCDTRTAGGASSPN